MTPRLFSSMAERYRERKKQEDRRAGEMIVMFYNSNRSVEADPKGLEWQDVFPEWKEPEKEQTEEEMFATMMLFTKSTEGLSH